MSCLQHGFVNIWNYVMFSGESVASSFASGSITLRFIRASLFTHLWYLPGCCRCFDMWLGLSGPHLISRECSFLICKIASIPALPTSWDLLMIQRGDASKSTVKTTKGNVDYILIKIIDGIMIIILVIIEMWSNQTLCNKTFWISAYKTKSSFFDQLADQPKTFRMLNFWAHFTFSLYSPVDFLWMYRDQEATIQVTCHSGGCGILFIVKFWTFSSASQKLRVAWSILPRSWPLLSLQWASARN